MQQPDKSKFSNGPVDKAATTGGSMAGFPRLWSQVGSREFLGQADAWLARFGVWIILAFAVLYYGQYYRTGLNLGGEGGTVAVIALRLMEGQRPIADTFLGYNVMWFYPVVWLFQAFGPNYVLLRIYFFILCALTGLLAFLVMRRATGSGIFSLLTATLVVLIPGMIFRNYMAFLGLLNMYLLLQAFVFSHRRMFFRWCWLAAAGLGLGLTYLIRVDIGIFFTVIALGLAILFLFLFEGNILQRLKTSIGGIILILLLALLVHVPVYEDARRRNFAPQFLDQYGSWLGLMGWGVKSGQAVSTAPTPIAKPVATTSLPAAKVEVAEEVSGQSAASDDGGVLQRPKFTEAFSLPTFYDRAFVWIIYLPIFATVVLLGGYSIQFLLALLRRWQLEAIESLTILTALGSALTLFPQFFFFRPDTPHLSEFMAPFIVALACGIWAALRWMRGHRSLILRILCGVAVCICVVNIALYTYHSMPKESAGTIAANRKRTYDFKADNGIHVWLKQSERTNMQGLYEVLSQKTAPGEYVVCYPYAPTINFMVNRRSYERNLYVDNATAPQEFHDETVREMAEFRPAAIVIDNRKINKGDSSQFANWASKTYDYIKSNYTHAGTFGRQEVYLRPDKAL